MPVYTSSCQFSSTLKLFFHVWTNTSVPSYINDGSSSINVQVSNLTYPAITTQAQGSGDGVEPLLMLLIMPLLRNVKMSAVKKVYSNNKHPCYSVQY